MLLKIFNNIFINIFIKCLKKNSSRVMHEKARYKINYTTCNYFYQTQDVPHKQDTLPSKFS